MEGEGCRIWGGTVDLGNSSSEDEDPCLEVGVTTFPVSVLHTEWLTGEHGVLS